LTLEFAPLPQVLAILNWLDGRRLENLSVEFMRDRDRDSTPPAYPLLATPKLRRLGLWTIDTVGLNRILNHLQGADGLDTLEIIVYIYKDQNSVYNLDPLKSLFARLASTTSDKGEVLFPRLQKLDFSAQTGETSAGEVDDAPAIALSTRHLSESQELVASELVTHLLSARANAGAVPLGLKDQAVGFPDAGTAQMIHFKANPVQEMR